MLKKWEEWKIKYLYKLFKMVWTSELVPEAWKIGKFRLLHKGGNKSKKELRNYRPIALLNTIGKTFVGILNIRLKQLVETFEIISDEQNGFRAGRRGEDNLYIVREIIEKYNREKKTGFITFLDIEKAYDRVNRSTLMQLLKHLGIPNKFINIIKDLYTGTESKYILGDVETGWIKGFQGVRQGCVLSPLLFSLYTEELVARVKGKALGIGVGNDKISLLLYADDIIMFSENKEDMQELLNAVHEYNTLFDVNISVEKSKIMVLNEKEEDKSFIWRLGNVEIGRTNEYKYLGINVCQNGFGKAKTDKIFKCNQWFGRLGSAVKFRANKYEVVRGVWKALGVPNIMYAAGVLPWNAGEFGKLEVAQNKIGRLGLGAKKMVGTETIRGEMGWSTFEERILKNVLNYKVRLENLEDSRWVRKVYIMTFSNSLFIKRCVSFSSKCGLGRMNVMNEEGRRVEWKTITDDRTSSNWSKEKWKKEIDSRVTGMGLEKWKHNIENKSTLALYHGKEKPRKELFYDGSKRGELLFKARTGSMELNARTYRWNPEGTKNCLMCRCGDEETIEHCMVECKAF